LDAKELWKPGQSFILAGCRLSLSCLPPSGTGQTTTDTGCNSELRNCVDNNLADNSPFKNVI